MPSRVTEIVFWELIWRIQASSITGSFGESCLLRTRLDMTRLLSVTVKSSGLFRKLPRCNIGRTSKILIDDYRDFPQPLEAKDWFYGTSVRPRLLPSKSFPDNYSQFFSPFHATWSELMTASWNKRRRNRSHTILRSVCLYVPDYRCHLPEKCKHRHINLQSHITNYCASRFSDCYWNQFGVYSQQLSVFTSVLLYARILELFDDICKIIIPRISCWAATCQYSHSLVVKASRPTPISTKFSVVTQRKLE